MGHRDLLVTHTYMSAARQPSLRTSHAKRPPPGGYVLTPLPSKWIQVSDYATHQDLASWSDDKFRPAASPGPLWGRSAGRDQAFLMRPSCVRAVIPSSSPTSSRILPSFSLSTVVPVKCIFRPVANGNDPIRKSLKAGPVCVPPPSHCPTT